MSVLGWTFAAPALLWGLLALPILWLILRAIPPAPIRRRFPAVVLLLGLDDKTRTADRTPWWLLLLRALAIAAAIVGFAGPTRAPLGDRMVAGPRRKIGQPCAQLRCKIWQMQGVWAAAPRCCG
jgi:hypothetical protein